MATFTPKNDVSLLDVVFSSVKHCAMKDYNSSSEASASIRASLFSPRKQQEEKWQWRENKSKKKLYFSDTSSDSDDGFTLEQRKGAPVRGNDSNASRNRRRNSRNSRKETKVLTGYLISDSEDDEEKQRKEAVVKPSLKVPVRCLPSSRSSSSASEDELMPRFRRKPASKILSSSSSSSDDGLDCKVEPKKEEKEKLKKEISIIVLSSDEENVPDEDAKYLLGIRSSSPGYESDAQELSPLPLPPKRPPAKTLQKKKPLLEQGQRLQELPSPFPKPASGTVMRFLSSLSVGVAPDKMHPEAVPYLQNFRNRRAALTQRLFNIFNVEVFASQLPSDMPIVWNKRLVKTAGLCRMKFQPRGEFLDRICHIDLSEKVIDAAWKLRDTLIHEMCHAATWIVDNTRRDMHGPLWQRWARIACKTLPELPAITRCHNYTIVYKFNYACGCCGWKKGRHSKALKGMTCKYCSGQMELEGNGSAQGANAKPPRTPSAFANFVKDNYGLVKKENLGMVHRDVMRLLSKQFAIAKINN